MRIWRGVMAGLVGGAIAAGAMSVAHGAEMLREIARFWASAATDNPELDRYEIRGVMGPDEYHDAYPGAARPGLNNNAYTSAMAAWVLWRTVEVLDLMPDDERRLLRERLGVTGAEVAEWDRVSRRLRLVFPPTASSASSRGTRPCRSSTGTATASATGTSIAWTSSWRPRATRRTATSSPSSPTCSCSTTSSRPRSWRRCYDARPGGLLTRGWPTGSTKIRTSPEICRRLPGSQVVPDLATDA